MGFSDFRGNSETVHRLRDMLARKRLPQAVILSGPRGSGKYTLALMMANAINCLARSHAARTAFPTSVARCSNCIRIAQSEELEARFAEAVEARENLRETDKKETRLFVQTHPDVLIIPPDPPQMMIKVDQVRRVIETVYYRPSEAKERVYIFTDSAFMKEAANSLLKVLEEPPEYATIFLLTENPGELLPTIRSRSMTFTLGASRRGDRKVSRETSAELEREREVFGGTTLRRSRGQAQGFDLAKYTAARNHALIILSSALRTGDHSELFKTTETYRPGAEGREKNGTDSSGLCTPCFRTSCS